MSTSHARCSETAAFTPAQLLSWPGQAATSKYALSLISPGRRAKENTSKINNLAKCSTDRSRCSHCKLPSQQHATSSEKMTRKKSSAGHQLETCTNCLDKETLRQQLSPPLLWLPQQSRTCAVRTGLYTGLQTPRLTRKCSHKKVRKGDLGGTAEGKGSKGLRKHEHPLGEKNKVLAKALGPV